MVAKETSKLKSARQGLRRALATTASRRSARLARVQAGAIDVASGLVATSDEELITAACEIARVDGRRTVTARDVREAAERRT